MDDLTVMLPPALLLLLASAQLECQALLAAGLVGVENTVVVPYDSHTFHLLARAIYLDQLQQRQQYFDRLLASTTPAHPTAQLEAAVSVFMDAVAVAATGHPVAPAAMLAILSAKIDQPAFTILAGAVVIATQRATAGKQPATEYFLLDLLRSKLL